MPKLFPILVLCLYHISGYAADTQIGLGSEVFAWQEFDSTGTRILTENGQRYRFSYQLIETDEALRQYSLSSIYFGDVNYDGHLLDGTPYTAISGYTGISLEHGWQLQLIKTPTRIYTELGLGVDIWQRQLDKTGALGYTETFSLLFVRWNYGIQYRGFFSKVGLKSPLYIHEYVDLGLSLKPIPQLSSYAELGYRFGQFVLTLYADDYRLGESPSALYNGDGRYYHQPTSTMDTLGLRFSLRY